jgi:lysine 2,3-aminomutase
VAHAVTADEINAVCDYLAAHPAVSEVIVSGGDPLTLDDGFLDALLGRLRSVPSVKVLRLSSRVPAVDPDRITADLAACLNKHGPLYVSTHFNHPRELTATAVRALDRLADTGIPLANQTVLLAGINDAVPVLAELCRGLYACRVRPYYLHQCDLTRGTGHFRTPLRRSLILSNDLRAGLSGLAAPLYMVDLPGGGGKVPVDGRRLQRTPEGVARIRNLNGQWVDYPDIEPG